ncbi:FAD-containing monooxygenase EthA [Cytospora mali]|uniref:FAD-containing monooxygenase EthA n=1 Tax=Cytospora mali TaxID=578113 RepID=A0A194V5V4_CYTMA|nr:FAD-containing monooxygenase EthA [Valsa mali var. pyri (nom. inval.)]
MGSIQSPDLSFDIIIIGAGIAGINCAYRLQTRLPNAKFAVLEGRDLIGGTWDLFKYPGIRSDSDLFTYGFAWHPWPHKTPIAEGPLIISYLQECISLYHLDQYISLRHKVVGGDWDSEKKRWTLSVDNDGTKKVYRAKWVVLASGYYDYDTPLETAIPGLDRFQGKIIHPQFWDTGYDLKEKRLVVIGSGATAVTLLPALVKSGVKHVTMLQRSPTWIVGFGNRSPLKWTQLLLPKKVVAWLEWLWFAIVPFFNVCVAWHFPKSARKKLLDSVDEQLKGSNVSSDPHFTPSYNPWEQRVCLAPDGDFFQALHGKDGQPAKGEVVTAKIKTVTEDGIECEDGKQLQADAIVTATGLKMCWGGKIPLRVDGELVSPADHIIWNGCMVNDVPNLMFTVGYAWASWTLGVDNTAITLCRLWDKMQEWGKEVAIPRLPAGYRVEEVDKVSWLNLTATYIKKAGGSMPWNDAHGKGPWKARGNVWIDWIHARFGNITKALELS